MFNRICASFGVKTMNLPNASGNVLIYGTMASGCYVTSLVNSIYNFVINFECLSRIYGDISQLVFQKKIKFWFYGDDLMILIHKELKFREKIFQYKSYMSESWNMKLKDDYFCDTLFFSFTSKSPVFLKNHFTIRECEIHGKEVIPYRPSVLGYPKLFIPNEVCLVLPHQIMERTLCWAYVFGSNFEAYKQCYKAYRLAYSMLDTFEFANNSYDEFVVKKLNLLDIDLEQFQNMLKSGSFPSHDHILNHYGCPREIIRTPFQSWEELILQDLV